MRMFLQFVSARVVSSNLPDACVWNRTPCVPPGHDIHANAVFNQQNCSQPVPELTFSTEFLFICETYFSRDFDVYFKFIDFFILQQD